MKNFKRSKTDSLIGGVIGGLAKSINIDSSILRVIFTILLFVPGIRTLMVIGYISSLLFIDVEDNIVDTGEYYKDENINTDECVEPC